MSESVSISIYEVVGSHLCVASSDGQKVYERLAKALKGGRPVAISFRNVTIVTSAFLNAAIGQLYGGQFTEEKIRNLLTAVEIDREDRALLKRVVDNAKLYFSDPERFDRAYREVFGGEDDEE